MSIEFRCSGCERILRVPDDAVGRQARCPSCEMVVTVPTAKPPAAAEPAVGNAPPMRTAPPANPFAEAPTDSPAGETYNPYASPQTTSLPDLAGAGGALSHQSVTFDVVGFAWKAYQAQFGTCVLFGLIIIGISIASGIVSIPLSLIEQFGGIETIIISQIAQNIWSLAVNVFTTCISALFALAVLRRHHSPFSVMFNVGPCYLNVLGMFLLVMLGYGGAIGVVASPLLLLLIDGIPEEIVFAIVGILAFAMVCAGIVVGFMIFLSSYFIIDRQAGVIESLQLSARYMAGNKFMTFAILFLMCLLGSVAVFITCFIGILFVIPFLTVLNATIYLAATGQLQSPPGKFVAAAQAKPPSTPFATEM